jgi:hypothetical protein
LTLPRRLAYWPNLEFQTQTHRFGASPGLIAEGRAALGAIPERFAFGVRDVHLRKQIRRPSHGTWVNER